MRAKIAALLLAIVAWPTAAMPDTCRDLLFEGASFTACTVQTTDDLRLFHSDASGAVYGSFSAVNDALAPQGQTLGFAMNAGMYHADRAPVGLYIENTHETAAIVTSDGPGNFGLLPNGVFCIGNGFAVIESRRFAANPPACTHASQSGPMLVIDGALHPRFLATSDSLYLRNGVGTAADGQSATFVIANDPVNFHTFARLFRDHLALPDALYFDGKISRLYAPGLNRHDAGFPMGPIIGTVITQPAITQP